MDNKKPNLKRFDEYMLNLEGIMHKRRRVSVIEDALVNELKMCRRLRDEKVIDENIYTQARTKIFKHERYKAWTGNKYSTIPFFHNPAGLTLLAVVLSQ